MAIITVTSALDDDGAGITLREAIDMANANVDADTIVFDASLAGQTIRLTQGTLEITQGTVTINGDTDGDGDANFTVSGDVTGNTFSSDDIGVLLKVVNGATANVQSMTFADGYAYGNLANGNTVAGLLNEGTLNISDTSIVNMRAYGMDGVDGSRGTDGGLAVAGIVNSGVMTVTDTIFEANQAFGGDGGDSFGSSSSAIGISVGNSGGHGGDAVSGIYTSQQLEIVNSGFVNNLAEQGDGGHGGYASFFGGKGGNTGQASTGIFAFSGTVMGTAASNDGLLIIGTAGLGGGNSIPGSSGGASGVISAAELLIFAEFANATGFEGLTSQSLEGTTSGKTSSGNDTIITNFAGPTFGLAGDDTMIGGDYTILFGGSGNDSISGNETFSAYGGSGNDRVSSFSLYAGIIDGGTGVDTFDYSGSNLNANFDLNSLYINIKNTSITGFENVVGTKGSNIIAGNTLDNIIEGHAGADNLSGGGNTTVGDMVSYEQSDALVIVNLATNSASGGHATGDVISGFENVTGSEGFGDTLIGSTGANVLNGLGGNDKLRGGVGADVLDGGSGDHDIADYTGSNAAVVVSLVGAGSATGGHAAGDTLLGIEDLTGSAHGDTLIGGDNANVLFGGAGDDRLRGWAGADVLNGGSGVRDIADYTSSTAAVFVSIGGSATETGGHAQGDTLIGIEDLIGSAHGDTLTGNSVANILIGGAGADTLTGGAGADTLSGGSGIDRLNGGAGNDALNGGGDADVFVYNIAALWNNDTITGWQNGLDKIDLLGAGFDFADLTETQDGSDTLLTLTANTAHSIRLIGINATTIDATDFI